MSRKFSNRNGVNAKAGWYYRAKWETQAYLENNGAGPLAAKDLGFVERINYGFIDDNNYSVVPKEVNIVPLNSSDPLKSPRVFDFVADAFSVMKLNYIAACRKKFIIQDGAFGDLTALRAYENPVLKYNDYIGNILRRFNKEHIPDIVGIKNITSYSSYVNVFFEVLKQHAKNLPVTFTRYQKSIHSSVLDTGLAIKFFDLDFDRDQRKINSIIDHPSFEYFKNLCLNTGFSFLHNRPNILLFDMASPAAKPYLERKSLSSLSVIFERRFDKTHMHDMGLLFNNINMYYNEFVLFHPQTKLVSVKCNKTVSEYIYRESIPNDYKHLDYDLIRYCANIRNIEEGNPFTQQKIRNIIKKSNYLYKKLDMNNAMGYISNMFKDQVWNKDGGYDDLIKSLKGETTATSGNIIKGERTSPSTGGGMNGGSSSGY